VPPKILLSGKTFPVAQLPDRDAPLYTSQVLSRIKDDWERSKAQGLAVFLTWIQIGFYSLQKIFFGSRIHPVRLKRKQRSEAEKM